MVQVKCVSGLVKALVLGLITACALWTMAAAQSLVLIEPHFGRNGCVANSVSDDGSVVVGNSLNVTGIPNVPTPQTSPWWAQRAFRWTSREGTRDLGTFGLEHTYAEAVSADGRVVVGLCFIGSYAWRAYRWTRETGLQDLGTLGIDWVDAHDVSSDGNTVVGYAYTWEGMYGFRWTTTTGMVSLNTLPGYRFSSARAVSHDGTVIVGDAKRGWAPYWNEVEAWRWTATTGMMGLGSLPGWYSEASGVSADGTTVVGRLHNGAWPEPYEYPYRSFRWRADTGMQDVGTLGGERTFVGQAVNRDGTAIFGASQNARGEWRAFRWTPQRGMEDINTLYASSIPAGWVLRYVSDCSSDGRYLVGWAEGPGGVVRGFLLDTGGGQGSATRTLLSATPTTLVADNRATSTLTLTYRYTDGTPIVGRTIRFRSSRGAADIFSSETAVTNSQGQVSVTVRSGTPGVSTFTCRDETAGVDLPASVQVTFRSVDRPGPVIGTVKTSLGVEGPFLQDVPLQNTITVQVDDWNGEPGRVEFRLPNGVTRSVQAVGSAISITLDMGRDLLYETVGRWNEVWITVYNREGAASTRHVVHLFAYSLPNSLRPLRNPECTVGPGGHWISYSMESRFPPVPFGGTVSIMKPIPVLQGSSWGMSISPFYKRVTINFDTVQYGRKMIPIRAEATLQHGLELSQEVSLDFFSLRLAPRLYFDVEYQLPQFKLSRLAIGAALDSSISFPVWQTLKGIICLVGRLEVDIDGRLLFGEGDPTSPSYQNSDMRVKAKPSVGLQLGLLRWMVPEIAAGLDSYMWLACREPGSPEWNENKRNFWGLAFIRQVGAGVYLKGGLEVIVIFLKWEGSEEILDWLNRPWLYPSYLVPWNPKPPPALLLQPATAYGWREPGRDYLWGDKPYHVMPSSRDLHTQDGGWDTLEQPLVLNTFRGASPVFIWKDGRAIILYVWDDPNLPAHQSTEIRALMQQPDGSWRDVAVTQDTALDSQPSVAVDGVGNLVAVWTRLEDVSPQPDPSLRLPKGEIAYSVYNESTGQWSAPRKLTNDNVLDFQPQLLRGADGGLYLHWLKSPDNTMPFNLENPSLPHTDIWTAIWNGTRFVFASRAVRRADTLEASLAVNSLGYPMIVWSADADGNPETEDSRLLYTYWDGNGWRSPMPVRADTLPQSSPTLAVAQGDLPVLFFVRSGLPHPQHEGYTQEQLVVTTFNGAGWASPTAVTQANTLSDLQVNVTPDGKVSAMWVSSSEGVADVWTTIYDGALGSYSQPVRLTQDDMTHEQQLSAAWDPAGNPSAVYIKRRLETEERQIQDEQGNWYPIQVTVPKEADLYLLSHRPMPDLTISEFWLDPSNAGAGMPVTMKAKVRNLRALGASGVRVRFYDGDPDGGGVPIGTAIVSPSALAGGVEGEATLQWTLPDDGKARTVYARVDPDNTIAEKDETNNTASWVVAQLDLAAVAPYVVEYLPDGRLKVKFGVQNPSAVNGAREVFYRLRLGDAQGPVLVLGTLDVPARGEVTTTEWIWSPQLSAGRHNLYLEIDPENQIEEADEGNNTAQSEVALAADLLVNPALTWLQRGEAGQATVHTTIQNNGWAEARNVVVQVRTALEGGRVLASATVERLGRYEVSSLSLPISLSEAGSQVWVVVDPDGTIDEVRRDNNMIGLRTAARTYSVSGQLELQDYGGDVTGVPVTVQVRQEGNVLRTEIVSLDAQGGYTLYHLAPGTYDLAFKASHWLRRVRPVEVVASDVLGVSVSLVNGDVDDDNEVTLFDFGLLVAAFGSVPGDANWNAQTDLDGDEEVTLVDFGILVRNFGLVGDQ